MTSQFFDVFIQSLAGYERLKIIFGDWWKQTIVDAEQTAEIEIVVMFILDDHWTGHCRRGNFHLIYNEPDLIRLEMRRHGFKPIAHVCLFLLLVSFEISQCVHVELSIEEIVSICCFLKSFGVEVNSYSHALVFVAWKYGW
ncbi:hypothetical protein DK261_19480 [Pseudomonas sp. RW409]|nr:hypothetical protein DK261_19480 [Pseudomonas sp. RW409]